jgi:capsular exopolysaccharide synthesis family protein
MSLGDLFMVVRRRKLIIATAIVLVPIVAVVIAKRKPNLYAATAQAMVQQQNAAATLAGIPATGTQDPTRYGATQRFLARSPSLAAAVVRAARVKVSADQLLAMSSVDASPNADVLAFTIHSGNPAFARKLADAYAREFVAYRRQLDTSEIERARLQVVAQMDSLVSKGKANTGLYDVLTAREQQLETIEALQKSNALFARPSSGASLVSPRPRRDALLALGLGLVLGIALAFLREATDTRIRSVEEIHQRLHIPLLVRIGSLPRHLLGDVVMLREPMSVEAEAYRMLRTNVDLVNLDLRAKTILITSAIEGEGKTTTASNLAVAFARAGRKTILLDLDLRRPSIDAMFDLPAKPGVTTVALGEATIEAALHRIHIDDGAAGVDGSLHVMTSGSIPPDPGEWVGSRVLAGILTSLRERADVIVIDTPPLLHVGDAMALTDRVDAMIVVTQLQRVRRGMLGEVRRLLDRAPAAQLGFVVIGTPAGSSYDGADYAGRHYSYYSQKDLVA